MTTRQWQATLDARTRRHEFPVGLWYDYCNDGGTGQIPCSMCTPPALTVYRDPLVPELANPYRLPPMLVTNTVDSTSKRE